MQNWISKRESRIGDPASSLEAGRESEAATLGLQFGHGRPGGGSGTGNLGLTLGVGDSRCQFHGRTILLARVRAPQLWVVWLS